MDTLNVFFEQLPAGTLTLESDRSFSFQYDEEWMNSPDGFQLSVSLPFQKAPITGNPVRAFFANLLPESAARTRIALCLGLSEKNDFMLLKALGGDCAGAISLLPEGGTPPFPQAYDYKGPMTPSQLADAVLQIPARPLMAGKEDVRISLAGAQEKLVLFEKADGFYIPLNNAPSNCILKPPMGGFDSAIENECFCIMLAGNTGLPVRPARVLTLENLNALVVQRYDREVVTGITRRLHQEDFCQAMGLSHELKYQAEGGPGLEECFRLIRDYSANPVKDVQLLLKWVFFNFLTGNMDGHAKNLSLLYRSRSIRLAPFYDLICTEVYDGLSKKAAMKIGKENRPVWIMERHWARFAREINISPKVLKKHLAVFCTNIADSLDHTALEFFRTYGENDLVKSIVAAVKKRAARTLAQALLPEKKL